MAMKLITKIAIGVGALGAVLGVGYITMKSAHASASKSGKAPTGIDPSLAKIKGLADGRAAGEFDFVSGLAKGSTGPSSTKASASGSAADYNASFVLGYESGYNAAKLAKGTPTDLTDIIGKFGTSTAPGDTSTPSEGTSPDRAANDKYAAEAFKAGQVAGRIDGARDGAESPLRTAPHPNPQPTPSASSFYKTNFIRGYNSDSGYGPAYAEYQSKKSSSPGGGKSFEPTSTSTDSTSADTASSASDVVSSWWSDAVSGVSTSPSVGQGQFRPEFAWGNELLPTLSSYGLASRPINTRLNRPFQSWQKFYY
jgi:hypothetical protein